MEHFLKKVGVFFLILVIFVTVLSFILIPLIKKSNYYKIESDITDIYIGDSHIRQAVVDSLLSNSQNIALDSESLYFTYYRLKKIFESENDIETVYLGFSYHTLSDYYDDYIYGEFSNSTSPKYFFLLPFSEQKKMLYLNRKNNYVKGLIKNVYKPILNNSKFGGYSNVFMNTKSIKSSMDKRINLQYYTENKINQFSQINLLYLEKIINLSIINNFKLIIVNTPLDSYYKAKIPIEYIDKYDSVISKYDLPLIDFCNITFDENQFIPDGDHLSKEGALKMTKELINLQKQNVAF
ncbi:hypothetical protein ULMA_22760 [Patiriisocius marinus]|uniref:SGNH/GDSL hydrolase family protein n=1 Tax=Patiriisocius marinus TaxID=1397112 RepID=A0A5J4J2B9_9FLAO|nr:hypothetical protein [Patiriisocius marinus]GER60168.1 hypothetical protein ULMA_22760 [Patiriisocius marinus]